MNEHKHFDEVVGVEVSDKIVFETDGSGSWRKVCVCAVRVSLLLQIYHLFVIGAYTSVT